MSSWVADQGAVRPQKACSNLEDPATRAVHFDRHRRGARANPVLRRVTPGRKLFRLFRVFASLDQSVSRYDASANLGRRGRLQLTAIRAIKTRELAFGQSATGEVLCTETRVAAGERQGNVELSRLREVQHASGADSAMGRA